MKKYGCRCVKFVYLKLLTNGPFSENCESMTGAESMWGSCRVWVKENGECLKGHS